jgi:hypothetical protein
VSPLCHATRARRVSALLAGTLVSAALEACTPGASPALDASIDAGPARTDTASGRDGGALCAPAAVVTLPALADPRLVEVSGIVASRRDPGVRYVHNDSGEDATRFYAVLPDGSTLAEIVIDGLAPPRDWEDVAIETTRDGREILSFGDVGDNAARDGMGTPRASISVVRVEPPALPSVPTATALHVAPLAVVTLLYPDAPHDCEAILVEPETGDLYLVTKEAAGPAGLYRAAAPLLDGETRTLERVASILPSDALVTGADADARFVVARTYGRAWLWERRGRGVAEVLAGAGTRLPAVGEPQGEAIALEHDGSGAIFATEGAGEPLHFVPFECGP